MGIGGGPADSSRRQVSPYPELTVLGILVRPLNRELRDLADDVGILLTEFPNLTLIPATRYSS